LWAATQQLENRKVDCHTTDMRHDMIHVTVCVWVMGRMMKSLEFSVHHKYYRPFN